MNNIIQTIRHTARAATVLLLALLAAQTAWAQGNIRQVSNADDLASAFDNTAVSEINVTDNITGVGNLRSIERILTINLNGYTISGDELHFNVDPYGSLTINGGGQDGSVGNIISGYADGPAIENDGTVTLSNVNITTYPDCAIYGLGTLNIGDKVSFKYISDIDNAYDLAKAFGNTNVSVINVTDNITGVGILLPLNRDLTINLNGHTISGDGLHIDAFEGCSLTINGEGQDGSVGNIISGYADVPAINSEGTVTLRNVNITTNYDFAIGGPGMLYIGENVSFNGWTGMPFNTHSVYIIEGGNYNYDPENLFANVVASVTVGGQTHYFENSDAALAYIVSHPDNDDFSLSGDTYTIKSANGWDLFCALLAQHARGYFSGKTVELGADIGTADDPVTSMAGASGKEFTGTFDGNKKTLTVSISSSDGNAAPFREIMGATIRNLKVSGTVSGHKHSAGLVSYARGADSSVENTIENCLVATDVSTIVDTDGDCYLGGIVGHGLKSKLTIRGCAFTGSLTSPHNYTGGLQGWSDGNTLILENDLFAASSVNAANVGFHPIAFHVNNATTTATVSNVYYTIAPTCTTASRIAAAGKACHSVTAGENVTIDAIALTGDATEYNVSGITAYSGGGLQRGETLYYGSDDVVSLTLSNTGAPAGDVPDGYQYGYTASAGTLDGSTLTMPAADVTISVNTEVLTAIPWSGDGTEGSPYIIKYASQLDLLAHRINGTHGETLQTDGYKDTYFQLDKDISYPHTTDWDDAECEQESNFEPIGGRYNDDNRYFRGHFDGNNNTISGIRIYKNGISNADRHQGIFGRTGTVADIHDLTLADARITGYNNTGGIVGENYGTVTGCHVAADVAVCAVQPFAWNHGGIAGLNSGTIEQCTSAATLTTADADNSKYYGGIAGYNYGPLSDNLAIGATVPAAGDNTYGAITGENDGTLQRNYYTACNVADTENATGVGCGYIGNGNGGYTTADVNNDNNPNGARAVFALTLAEGITTTTPVTVTIGTTGYYAQGTAIALSYSGTPGNIPLGYQYEDSYGFTASAGTLEGSTLTMPAADVTVSLALRSTHAAVPVSYLDAGGTTLTHDAVALDGTESNLGTDDEETWYFVGLPTVAFDHTLRLNGNVHLILADGCTMNVTTSNADGIAVNGSLTIYGQTDGTGTLNATGFFAGIITDSGTITISGGRVTATSDKGYGITTYSGTITISGGTVNATGSKGIYTDSGDITISGGRVTATSDNGYGIYINNSSGTITISGGRVTATADNGYGIYTNGGPITISGGRVTVTSDYGTGIYTNSGTITLGCTTASDFIYASRYIVGPEGSLNIAGDQTLFDEYGNSYWGTINDYDYPHGKTLRPGLTARQAPDGNYWTTYYNSAQGFTIDKNENACAYTATYGAGQLTLHKLGELGKEIPAETAVIIVADNDMVSMTATTALDDFTDDNDLHGVDVDTDVASITSDLGTGTFYVLGMTTVGDEQHFGFHRYTGSEMAAHKAFVLVSGSQSARSLTMVFDEASGIESLTPDAAPKAQAAEHWFTLDGRRLQAKPTAPGIYINNGRKVMIK